MKRLFTLILLIFVVSTFYVYANDATSKIILSERASQNNFNGSAKIRALKMTEGTNYEVGIQFSLADDALFVGVSTPSYANNIGSMTFSLYNYDYGFHNSKSKEPIITYTFEDFNDNAFLGFSFDSEQPLKAGEYVLVLSEPYDNTSGVGVWLYESYAGQYVFIDEEYNAEYSLAMNVLFVNEPADGVYYGQLSDINHSPTKAPATASKTPSSTPYATATLSETPRATTAATESVKGTKVKSDTQYTIAIIALALVIVGGVIFIIIRRKSRMN